MQSNRTRTLVLTLAADEAGGHLFVGDLYIGCTLKTCVRHTRAAMLHWLAALDASAVEPAARAMDRLAARPGLAVRTVQLRPSPTLPSRVVFERVF